MHKWHTRSQSKVNDTVMETRNTPASRWATRIAFLIAGFGIACWAPLVPLVKTRLAIDESTLGLLLLCLGIGSLIAMMTTGILTARLGAKPIILAGGFGISVFLPLLTMAETPHILALALFCFGASLGFLDVAMNIHAVDVERDAQKPLMSGFHGLFSVGGFIGSALMTSLLSMGYDARFSAVGCSIFMVGSVFCAWNGLLKHRASEQATGPVIVFPRGLVWGLSLVAMAMFLVEGAVLDWGALLITSTGKVAGTQGGIAYMMFAITMTIGRLSGDAVVHRLGDKKVLLGGGIIALLGFLVLLLLPYPKLSLGGFFLIGIGASNIVPVLFRRCGTQKDMAPSLAVAAISTFGYAGVLLGPAAIGFIAKHVDLSFSFWLLAGLVFLVTISAHRITRS